MNFEKLYDLAHEKQSPREISPFISAGGVSSAILTYNGNVFTGVCIDTACTLGMCAERNAIANMITNGESRVIKLVCVVPDGSVASPCGACREYLMQLHLENRKTLIFRDFRSKRTTTLEELLPDWWGYSRYGV